MNKIFIFFLFLSNLTAFGQSSVILEPNNNNGILSKNATTVTTDPGVVALPVSGAGTRLMWIPAKSAFRVGTVNGTGWDANKIGNWSIASGLNAVASGNLSGAFGDGSEASGYASFVFGGNLEATANYSVAMGYSSKAKGIHAFAVGDSPQATGESAVAMGSETIASGDNSTAIGVGTTASGSYSTAMGLETTASGTGSTSMGFEADAKGIYSTSMGASTEANGHASISMGFATKANGDYSTSMNYYSTAQARKSVAMGYFNVIAGSPSSDVITDPLLVVGNGSASVNNNALTLLKNANLGLNTATPQYPFVFKDVVGDKISLYGGNVTNTTNHYGLGVQSAQLQIFTPSNIDDIVLGIGRSAAFTENVRFKGNGLVGIGVNIPSEQLDVNGRMRVRYKPGNTAGVWMSNDVNSTAIADGAFYGLKTNTEAGIFIGSQWRFYVNNAGNVTVGGTVTASCGILVCSDMRYKKNISALNNSLDNVLKVNGVRYDFKKDEFPERNFSDKNQIGFIAQDIEKIFPEMVFTDEKGYKSVDYARLTPVLVEAIKEQQKLIDDLRMTNDSLKKKSEKLESRLDKIETILSK